MVLVVKTPPANAGDTRDVDSIPGLGRSLGGGHGNPLQYSCPGESSWAAEPGRLQSMGSQRLVHDCSDLAHDQATLLLGPTRKENNPSLLCVAVQSLGLCLAEQRERYGQGCRMPRSFGREVLSPLKMERHRLAVGKRIALNMDGEFSPGRTQDTPLEMSKLDSELAENSDGYLGSK